LLPVHLIRLLGNKNLDSHLFLRIFNYLTKEEICVLKGAKDWVRGILKLDDTYLVATDRSKKMNIWNVKT